MIHNPLIAFLLDLQASIRNMEKRRENSISIFVDGLEQKPQILRLNISTFAESEFIIRMCEK